MGQGLRFEFLSGPRPRRRRGGNDQCHHEFTAASDNNLHRADGECRAALQREPRIARRARFVGMDAACVGLWRSKNTCANGMSERILPPAKGLARLDITISRSTLRTRHSRRRRYQRILQARNPVAGTIVENYRLWSKANKTEPGHEALSTLFDPVAVYLAFSRSFCRMERLGIRVTNDGLTVIDDQASG